MTREISSWLLLVGMSALPSAVAQERLSVDQLPEPVQRTLRASHYGPNAKQALRREIDGRIVYEVEIERNNAPNPLLRIAEDGSFVREAPVPFLGTGDMPMVLPSEPELVRLRLEDLPPRVQEAVKSAANGREIADIDRESANGRTVYEVEFRDTGPNARIHVAEDGTLIRGERRGGTIWSRLLGLQLEDVPPPVQETIRRVAGTREIADIDRKGTKAAPVYRVEIGAADSTQELRIDGGGHVLYDSRAPAVPSGKDAERGRGSR